MMGTITRDQAEAKVRAMIQGASNAVLADLLENALQGKDESRMFFHVLEAAARERVGTAAAATESRDWETFTAQHGLREDMSADEMDAIYDAIPDHELPLGSVHYLLAELRGVPLQRVSLSLEALASQLNLHNVDHDLQVLMGVPAIVINHEAGQVLIISGADGFKVTESTLQGVTHSDCATYDEVLQVLGLHTIY